VDSVDFNEPLSPSLERRVLTTLLDICENYLSNYPTTIEEDEVLVRDKALFAALGRQRRMAVKLRASEKRILYRTIQAVQEELQKLPSLVSASGEKIIAAGRSFEALKSKPTVATARSASDWVDIKGGSGGLLGGGSATGTDSSNPSPDGTAGNADGGGGSLAERRRRRRLSGK